MLEELILYKSGGLLKMYLQNILAVSFAPEPGCEALVEKNV